MTTYQEEKFPYWRDDSAVSKDQTTDCPKNQAMSQPGKQEVFDVDILKQSIKEYISELNKILFRARNAYA